MSSAASRFVGRRLGRVHYCGGEPVIITRGQMWADADGNRVVVADFCEYTAGWFVRIEVVEPSTSAEPDLIHEPKFRDKYRLVRDV